MTKIIFSKVMWVGRATVFVVGLAVILALVLGVATAALGANGGTFILGQGNAATAVTTLAGKLGVDGPMLRVVNNNEGANDTALNLRVQGGEAPMTVNSDARVTNLNADELDGEDSTGFLQNGAAAGGDLTGNYPDPQIAPEAVGSGEIASGTVGTGQINSTQVQRRVSDSCPSGSSIRSIAQEGPVVCESDGITGHQIVTNSSSLNNSTPKQVEATCPSGMITMSGGAQYSLSEGSVLISNTAEIALQRSIPSSTNRWAAIADYVGGGTPPEWRLIVQVVCIDA